MKRSSNDGRGPCPLPPQQLRFMGEDDAKFLQIGALCVQMLQRAARLDTVQTILDIGCGYGRLAHALLRTEAFAGQYYGLDILPQHIAWCQETISRYGDFHFGCMDVHNARYNPAGRHHVTDIDLSSLPPMDLVVFFSVFTHMYEEEIRFYLRSAASLLKPGGKVLCTAFLLNPSSVAGEKAGASRYPMPHVHNAHTRYYDEKDPLYAIGYDEAAFTTMVEESGLHVAETVLGGWCGRQVSGPLDPFQDLVIAQKK